MSHVDQVFVLINMEEQSHDALEACQLDPALLDEVGLAQNLLLEQHLEHLGVGSDPFVVVQHRAEESKEHVCVARILRDKHVPGAVHMLLPQDSLAVNTVDEEQDKFQTIPDILPLAETFIDGLTVEISLQVFQNDIDHLLRLAQVFTNLFQVGLRRVIPHRV